MFQNLGTSVLKTEVMQVFCFQAVFTSLEMVKQN